MSNTKDFCTIANMMIEGEIAEKEIEMYDYIDSKTGSEIIMDIVILEPAHSEHFKIVSSKCIKTNNIVYVFVEIEFLQDYNFSRFTIGNIDTTKVSLPGMIAFIGSVRAIGQLATSGSIVVQDVTRDSFSAGDKLSAFGSYTIG